VTQGAFSVDAAAQLEGKISMMNQTNVKPGFAKEISRLFDQYIVLKDAFVQGDVQKAKQTALKLQQSLAGVDMKLLSGDSRTQWMAITGKLDEPLKQIASAGDIERQRTDFSDLSNEFFKAIKTFGLTGKTVYYQFCPMAFDKGAFWLSTTEEIRNPYYGDQMLTCGEIKETLKY
jgi:Cu(I)/Ag(I) efflux system membrane fusion protein